GAPRAGWPATADRAAPAGQMAGRLLGIPRRQDRTRRTTRAGAAARSGRGTGRVAAAPGGAGQLSPSISRAPRRDPAVAGARLRRRAARPGWPGAALGAAG